jgi:hypothetical protein
MTQLNIRHARIKHKSHVYLKVDVHTNTVESAFSLLKRGLIIPSGVDKALTALSE